MSYIKEQIKKTKPQPFKSITAIHRKKTDFSKSDNNILNLQKNMGNQTLQRAIDAGLIQTKLTINHPNDKYEQEADSLSDRVMRMSEEEEVIQTKSLGTQITPLVQRQDEGEIPKIAENLESKINTLRGGGQPLSKENREFFEPRFGEDFSKVRVHTNSSANQLARSVNAKAFTRGDDVVFKSGEYNPTTPTGKRLLGHELTHVIQQRGSSTLKISRKEDEKKEKESPKDKAMKAVAKASIYTFLKTGLGKKFKLKLTKFVKTPTGISLASIGGLSTLSYLFAKNMDMSQGLIDLVPKFAKIDINKNMSISFQPIFKGKLNKPKEVGGIINFTIVNW